MINRTTITIHTRQRTVVRPLSDAPLVRCEECATEVLGVTTECAAKAFEVTAAAIGTLIESGGLHLTTSFCGVRLICGNSLTSLSTQHDEGIQIKIYESTNSRESNT